MVLPATSWCHNKQRHSPHNVSASYCVSVRSSRALFDMCSRNRFFWREWSLTRQFSTRRSGTGEWSITVNLPPLKVAEKRNEAVEGKTAIRFKGVYKAANKKENEMWQMLREMFNVTYWLTLFVVKLASSHWIGANKYSSLCPSERSLSAQLQALPAPASETDWSKEESKKHTHRKQRDNNKVSMLALWSLWVLYFFS